MTDKPHILVCPLDWGIGHATRCAPVIHELIEQNAEVTIGADNRPLAFLMKEFPELNFIRFPGYRFSYPENANMALKMAFQAPKILMDIHKERKALGYIIKDNQINGIISDNRFGLSTSLIPSVFLTHQLSIKVPSHLNFLNPLLNRINLHYISKFTECWIPDAEYEPNLSGELSHKNHLAVNNYFIGPLSRFAYRDTHSQPQASAENESFDILVILSGPEPQRSILEEMILKQLKNTSYKAAIICGKPEIKEVQEQTGRITVFPHLETKRLFRLIQNSKIIISRPGYSTVMDLAVSGKKAIFIPTPGQTEQEYLAQYYTHKKWFFCMSQNNFNLIVALQQSESFSGIMLNYSKASLINRISAFLIAVNEMRRK